MKHAELIARLEGGERTWLNILRSDSSRILPPEVENTLLGVGTQGCRQGSGITRATVWTRGLWPALGTSLYLGRVKLRASR